jgi:hypothetical protein
MTNFNHLKQSAKVAVIAASLIAGYTTLVSAHSLDACLDAVYDFCEAAHGDPAARHACIVTGSAGCAHHSHPGGSAAPDPAFSATPKPQYNKNFKFNNLQR